MASTSEKPLVDRLRGRGALFGITRKFSKCGAAWQGGEAATLRRRGLGLPQPQLANPVEAATVLQVGAA